MSGQRLYGLFIRMGSRKVRIGDMQALTKPQAKARWARELFNSERGYLTYPRELRPIKRG